MFLHKETFHPEAKGNIIRGQLMQPVKYNSCHPGKKVKNLHRDSHAVSV